jgi:hypothetical protein
MAEEAKKEETKKPAKKKKDDSMLVSTYLTQKGIKEKYLVASLRFQYRGIIKTKSEWDNELKDRIKTN